MSLHVCPGVICIWVAVLPFVMGKKLSFWLSACIDCGAVALSVSPFPFGVLDGRCLIIVSDPDHCLPFY